MQNNSSVILSENEKKDISIFSNPEFGSVRIIELNGKIYFCGSDVASALGYAKPRNAIETHCRYALKQGVPHPQSKGKTIEMSFIPEGDVYRLIVSSKLPSAQKFESWVFDEVLPSIAHTGSYDLSKQKKEAFERKSKDTRNAFTDTLKTHGYTKQHEYIQTTVQMKKELGIKKPKKEMDMKEKAMVLAAEALSMACITDEFGYQEVNPICLDAADNIAGYVEEKTNKKIGA